MICQNDDDCYGCRLRRKRVSVSASATPSRVSNRKPKARPMRAPSWEGAIAGEHRPGGTFMPYVNPNGSPLRVKDVADRRGHVEAQVDRLKSDPHVFAAQRAAATKE